jgi:hypothetical protein
MNAKKFTLLGTLQQQRAALPQLIYRDGVSTPASAPAPSSLTYGLSPEPTFALSTSVGAHSNARSQRCAPVFLGAESQIDSYVAQLGRATSTSADRANAKAKSAAPLAGILRALSLIGLLVLGGCAGFTQPITDMELRAEAESCARSSLCRTLIEDRPPVLTLAVNDARLCETNARIAESILSREGVETRRFVVRLKAPRGDDFTTPAAQTQLLHTFVAAQIDKRWYAVDNGSLPFCDRVCRLSEALHGVDLVSGSTKPEVNVGAVIVAAR